jgi:hypothetical protein
MPVYPYTKEHAPRQIASVFKEKPLCDVQGSHNRVAEDSSLVGLENTYRRFGGARPARFQSRE